MDTLVRTSSLGGAILAHRDRGPSVWRIKVKRLTDSKSNKAQLDIAKTYAKWQQMLSWTNEKTKGKEKDRSSGRRLSRAERPSQRALLPLCYCLSLYSVLLLHTLQWHFQGGISVLPHGPHNFWFIGNLRGNVPPAEMSVHRGLSLRAGSRQQQLLRMKPRRSRTMLRLLSFMLTPVRFSRIAEISMQD